MAPQVKFIPPRIGMTMNISELNKNYWQGRRIRLRAMVREDLDIWLEEEKNTEDVRLLSYGVELPKNAHSADEFALQYANFNNSHERIMFTIELLEGDVIGGINIHSMDQKNGTFGVGERIYQAYRGRGYSSEAKEIVLRYAFHELRFQKFNVGCIASNASQIKALTKFGCKEEGRIRRGIYTDGKYHDEVLFGMTREEYEEKYFYR